MGNALGVCESMYKVRNKEKVLLGEIWLASQNVTTRVSLLYIRRLDKLLNSLFMQVYYAWYIQFYYRQGRTSYFAGDQQLPGSWL